MKMNIFTLSHSGTTQVIQTIEKEANKHLAIALPFTKTEISADVGRQEPDGFAPQPPKVLLLLGCVILTAHTQGSSPRWGTSFLEVATKNTSAALPLAGSAVTKGFSILDLECARPWPESWL